MKRIIVLMVLLGLLSGCGQKGEVMEPGHPENGLGVNNYFKTEDEGETVGEHFQVKIVSVYRVDKWNVSYYQYQILICPVRDEKIEIEWIKVKASNQLDDYLSNARLLAAYPVLDSLERDLLGKTPLMKGRSNMTAYLGVFSFNNIANEFQEKMGISDQQFDEYMRTLHIEIKYNLIDKETLTVQLNHPIEKADDNEELMRKRNDLFALKYYYSGHAACVPYVEPYYPIGNNLAYYYEDRVIDYIRQQLADQWPNMTGFTVSNPIYCYWGREDSDGSIAFDKTNETLWIIMKDNKVMGYCVDIAEQDTRTVEYDSVVVSKLQELMDTGKHFGLYSSNSSYNDGKNMFIYDGDSLVAVKKGQYDTNNEEKIRQLFSQEDLWNTSDYILIDMIPVLMP